MTAAGIGVAPNTLRTLLRDDWDQLSREVIERICDRFNLQIDQLFELSPSTFWDSFEAANDYHILTGPTRPDETGQYQGRDARARTVITSYLLNHFPGIAGRIRYDLTSPSDLTDYLRHHNCLVVGSPRSNAITEFVVATHFGAVPFDSTLSNRQLIPFRFRFATDRTIDSAMVEPDRTGSTAIGISNRAGQVIARADWLPFDDYLRRTLKSARDCGLVMVINKPFNATKDVKTIVVAGFSGIGTEGAALALVRDFRDLTPLESSRHTLGVVEVAYQKPVPGSDERIVTGFKWRHLEGGRKKVTRRLADGPTAG